MCQVLRGDAVGPALEGGCCAGGKHGKGLSGLAGTALLAGARDCSREQPSRRAAVADPGGASKAVWVRSWTATVLLRGRSSSPSRLTVLAAPGGSACSAAASVWETPAPGETQEGVELAQVQTCERGLWLPRCSQLCSTVPFPLLPRSPPTAGDCSGQSVWRTSPSLRRVSRRAPTLVLAAAALLPQTASCWSSVSRLPGKAGLCSRPACPAARRGCGAPCLEQVLGEEREWRVVWGRDGFPCLWPMCFPAWGCS